MARTGLMKCLLKFLPDLEEPCPIFLFTKATKITIGLVIDVSIFFSGYMLQMYFSLFNVESIHRFTSTFVDIFSAPSWTFGFPSRIKFIPLDILKLLVATLRNQYNKVALVQVDEDVALEISSTFMSTCHNMNIMVQTTGEYEYSLNGKIEIPNKTLANTTRSLLLKSIQKKELFCFAYQYAIWLSCRADNILCVDVTYFL